MEYLVRYGEMALKSEGVRKKFEIQLARNISAHFRNLEMHASVILERGRVLVHCENGGVLKDIIGVTSYSPIITCAPDLQEITQTILALAKEKITPEKTFRMTFSREWKRFPKTSGEMEKELGAMVVEATGAKVRLKNPDVEIYAEIRQNHTHIYVDKTQGIGGMPYGTSGRVLCFIDSEDSLLAAFLALRRGCVPIFLVKNPDQIKPLRKFLPEKPRTYIQNENPMAQAEKIAKHTGALAIITGESKIQSYEARAIPIIRPLAGFDVDYAKKYAELLKA